MDTNEQRAYADWLERARPVLEAGRWGEALADVPRLPELGPTLPRPLRRPLQEATIGLVSTAAISTADQPPIDGAHIEGDYSIRLLPVDEPTQNLRVWHTHFDTAAALDDINTVYPVERLKELQADGVIGRLAPRAVSFNGFFTNVFRVRDELAPAVVEALQAQRVDAAVLVPV